MKIEQQEIIEHNEQSEVINLGGNSFVKSNDGSLIKLNNSTGGEDYDESNLIYR
jgi:hypothetical protein